MKQPFLYTTSLFFVMLIAGTFWGTWFTLTRSLENFQAEEFIHIGKTIIANVAFPMRIIMPACLLFMILTLWFYQRKKSTGFYLGILGLILMVTTLVITLAILVPIDNEIKQWTASTVPSGWEAIRSRWQIFHSIRTFTSLASFACFALATLNN